jgi:hypothetical protein
VHKSLAGTSLSTAAAAMGHPPTALQQLLLSMGDAPCHTPDATVWGFSLSHVTLQQLQQHHTNRSGAEPDTAAADTYLNKLETDHTFASNHCIAAMAQQLGLSQCTHCLSGTLQASAGVLPDAAAADAALATVRREIDGAWSKEAVWRGVGFAKEGALPEQSAIAEACNVLGCPCMRGLDLQ